MLTEVIKINPEGYETGQLKGAAEVLSKGGLVVFPTETVYGIGANADIPETVAKLVEIKKSPAGRFFTFHIADIDKIYKYVNKVPRLAHRLMRHFWPGPLTLVLPTQDTQWRGLRLPEHNVARDLIRLANVPVIAPSANLAGHPPPRNIENIVKVFDNKVDIIIDSGIVKYGQPSTVVKIKADNQWELLREGVIEKESIKKLDYKMILFVCTGNICRSPMAVGLFKKMLAEKLGIEESQLESKGYKIISGGTASIYNAPASENAITIMKELGSDISEHLSQPVTLTQIEEADQVYVMTQGHFTTLKEWTPDATDKMSLLNPSNEDIQDPIGSGFDVYRQCVLKLKHSLEVILDKI